VIIHYRLFLIVEYLQPAFGSGRDNKKGILHHLVQVLRFPIPTHP
jgi:hypothetical protein